MDLYTASHRLEDPFEIDGSPLPLSDHAAIGDGFTCALVGVDGAVSWLCLPRFDSPSVFASILDPDKGGRFAIAPAARRFQSLQAYDDTTNVIQTLFRRPGEGVLVMTDFMPWAGDSTSVHELLRLMEVREGSIEVEIVFDPRFDYGRGETVVDVAEHGAVAKGPNAERLACSLSPGISFAPREDGGVSARFRMKQGQRFWAILSWRSKRAEPIAAFRPYEQLRRTRRHWRAWASQLSYDGPWRHDVQRSALMLKLLQFEPTGAMVAAPTTSLPAWPGGNRNWDYRFSWTRDSAMAIRAMNLMGYPKEALDFFHFVRDCVDRRDKLDLMVSIDGEDTMQEQILGHLSGHGLGGVVRIGNLAASQLQHDIIGPLLDAAHLYERSGGMISLRLWREIRHLVDKAIVSVAQPDHGIWEPRAEPSHHVHSKLMTWVALDRALRLAPLYGGDREQQHWTVARDALRREILEHGYSPESGTFVGAYGQDHVDAALLQMPIYGFLPPDDERVLRTVDRIVKELGDGQYLKRYLGDDGTGSEEGAFILCGFWLAEALALAGRLDEALQVMHCHVGAANHVGLIAEEIDAATGQLLGNFPQAFSHLGLIQAAARLDLALRLRDEGAEHPPRHAFDLAT